MSSELPSVYPISYPPMVHGIYTHILLYYMLTSFPLFYYVIGMEEIAEALAQIVLERLIASRALLKAMIEGDEKLDMRDTNHDDDDGNKAKDTTDPRDEITLKVRLGLVVLS